MPATVVVLLIALAVPFLSPKAICEDSTGSGVCTREVRGPPVKCSNGVLVRHTAQAALGAAHLPVDARVEFASAPMTNGCRRVFRTSCSDDHWRVQSQIKCEGKAAAPDWQAPLGQAFYVCSASAASKVQSLIPVIDLSFDTTVAPGPVAGCVGVWDPSAFPHMANVRGNLDEQAVAIIAAKKAAGGCPTVSTREEYMARAKDFHTEFNPVLVFVIQQYLAYAEKKLVEVVEHGPFDPVQGDGQIIALFMSTMIAGKGPGGMMTVVNSLNCGEPMVTLFPMPGIMVTRHEDVGKMIADPLQGRAVVIGAGAEDFCFDRTLPVFVSTGTAEHTQVRKLWDMVGLATMAEREVPPIAPREKSTLMSLRSKAMAAAAGMRVHMPDEVAPIVAPLFLEMLWGKRPTQEEADTVATYMSIGGPCIMSPVLAKIPLLPGKIRAVREFAWNFASSSPVGKKIVQEIADPQYAELREMYASRPKGVAGTAIQNLVDASLFAGLVGTSSLTVNALAQLASGPENVAMFRQNSTAFILEVMRTATAVAGSQQRSREKRELNISGRKVVLPAGTMYMQATGFGAGLDAKVFPDPRNFDIARGNLDQTMNWNGLTGAVFARDYTRAPRFCPGAATSVKIAAKVCQHLTAEWAATEGAAS